MSDQDYLCTFDSVLMADNKDSKFQSCWEKNMAISVMSGKSSPSELNLEIIQSNNYLSLFVF